MPVRHRAFSRLAACVGAALVPVAAPAAPMTATVLAGHAIRDFLVMDVCVDERDRPVPGIPSQCARHRDVRAGEPVGYFAGNYPEVGDKRCFALDGYVRRYSFPLSQVGTHELIVSVLDHGGSELKDCKPGCSCKGPRDAATFGAWDRSEDGVSVLTYDSRYAYIMASKAQSKASYFLGPACHTPGAKGIDRFGPTWVISSNPPPQAGTWQRGLFESKLTVNTVPSAAQCTGHRTGFVAWTRDEFDFGPQSNVRLQAIVTEKFANAGDDNPGDAEQVERSYWTREFGITRWEKWERGDHVRRDQRDVKEQARHLRAKNTCGKPFGRSAEVSPKLQYSAVRDEDGLWVRDLVMIDGAGRRTRVPWYLVDCSDWTNAHPRGLFSPSASWNATTLSDVLGAFR
jgi:hypothetical protein